MMYSRSLKLLALGAVLVAPADAFAQQTGGVRARTKCVDCSRDSTYRSRQERLLLRIDSLRWEIEHVRMSPKERERLADEMTRTVIALEASLDGRANEAVVARVAPVPAQAFAFTVSRKPNGYLGVTFDGQPAAEKYVNGEHFIRFLQYPKIALVEPSSPAERAGIIAGDTLLSLGGQDVREEISLTKLLVPSSKLQVRIRREGDSKNIAVIVGETPDYYARRATPYPRAQSGPGVSRTAVVTPAPPSPSAVVAGQAGRPRFATTWVYSDGVAGAELKTISEGLGKALGAPEGVLVISTEPGTPAFRSGLRDGDIILKAGGRTVTTVGLLRNVVARGDGDEGVQLVILRERKQRELTLR
jgi:predicted metalloprotease with PDZ domain